MKTRPYIYTLPTSASFTGKGLLGYSFAPLSQEDIDFYYIEVEKGHDTFMVSRKITRTYYVLSGAGYFTIDNHKFDVRPGMLVEVPSKVEYSYSGKMTLIAFARPRWFDGNDTHTRWNPDVVGQDVVGELDRQSWPTRLNRVRIFGKSPVRAYLRFNQRLWKRLPSSLAALSPIRSYGEFLHKLARVQGARAQAFSTYFLRNRPQLELICRLLEEKTNADTLKVTVLGCSTGAQAYSMAWRIRSVRPDLNLILNAMDISKQAVKFAECGAYSTATSQLTNTQIFERMTAAEMAELFDRDGDTMRVKSWIREGINWHVGDVGESKVLEALGAQDIVVADNFLCHMDASEAERCLRNISRLVSQNGYLFVSGIDLDVRTKVARDLKWKPLQELIEEIHEGDPCMSSFWPFHYGGLEPLNKSRHDWKIRYAAAFQLGSDNLPHSCGMKMNSTMSGAKNIAPHPILR